jgi:hypothetical protein
MCGLVADYAVVSTPVLVREAASASHVSPLVLASKRSEAFLAAKEHRAEAKRIAFDGKHMLNEPLPDWPFRLVTLLLMLALFRFGEELVVTDYKSWFLQLPLLRRLWPCCTIRCPRSRDLLAYTRIIFGRKPASAQASVVSGFACADKVHHCPLVRKAVAYIDDETAMVASSATARRRLRCVVDAVQGRVPDGALHLIADYVVCDAPTALAQITACNLRLGLRTSASKTMQGRRVLLLGWWIDLLLMRFWAKQVTIDMASAAFHLIVISKWLTVKRMDRAAGYAMQLLPARWWAKCYARPLYIEKKRMQRMPMEQTPHMRAPSLKIMRCCEFWLGELGTVPFGGPIVNLNGLERTCSTQDASGLDTKGWGLIEGEVLCAGLWATLPAAIPNSTGAKELYPIVARVAASPEEHRGKLYMPRTDSLCAFHALNQGDSSSPGVFALLNILAPLCRDHDIHILAEWTPRGQNFEPDMLSKGTHPRQHCARQRPDLCLPHT